MMKEKICSGCGKTKKLDEFPTRGNEKNRHGDPVYRCKCKVCDSNRNTSRYHSKKAMELNDIADVYIQPAMAITEYPAFVPKSKTAGKFINSDEDYTPWEERLGRKLSEEERIELDSCTREFIVAMMNLVIIKKEKTDE